MGDDRSCKLSKAVPKVFYFLLPQKLLRFGKTADASIRNWTFRKKRGTKKFLEPFIWTKTECIVSEKDLKSAKSDVKAHSDCNSNSN